MVGKAKFTRSHSFKQARNAISSVLAVTLLILVSIAVGVVVYVFIFNYVTREPQVSPSIIKIEAYERHGRLLKLYVSNEGDGIATIDRIYYEDGRKAIPLQYATFTTASASAELWGGDTWTVDPLTLTVKRVSEGKILSDNFTIKNTTIWDYDYINHNNAWSAIYNDNDGLKILSKSNGGWAVRGIASNNPIDLSGNTVIIVDMMKTNYHVPYGDAAGSPFAACMYLTINDPHSDQSYKDPYYNAPWFALKLYPTSYGTVAQLVVRDSSGTVSYQDIYTWYSGSVSQPRVRAILIFNESDKVYYYMWLYDGNTLKDFRVGSFSNAVVTQLKNAGQAYLHLTIDNRVTTSSRKVHVRYIRVSRSSELRINGVEPGWLVNVTDTVTGYSEVVTATSTSVTIDLLPFIVKNVKNDGMGLPIKGSIKVLTTGGDAGITINPHRVRELILALPPNTSQIFTIKITTKDGGITSLTIRS